MQGVINERQTINVAEYRLAKYNIYGTYELRYQTFDRVRVSIDNGETMYINSHAHAVVLRGYRTDSDVYTYVMNPEQGSYSFAAHEGLRTGNNSNGFRWAEAITGI